MTYEAFDVLIVPFPFTDRPVSRKRPAVILSRHDRYGDRTGHCVVAMITAASASSWPLDSPVTDLAAAGLHKPCIVRMKLATIDQRLIVGKVGRLGDQDRESARAAIRELFEC